MSFTRTVHLLQRRKKRSSEQGGMLLLGLFTCLFLAMTCLPTIFSVGLIVNQRVNMALAAQNAAFAGTSQTNPNSSVIDLVEQRDANIPGVPGSAELAARVLTGNLSYPQGFGSGASQFHATIIVHDPMDDPFPFGTAPTATRMLITESMRANRLRRTNTFRAGSAERNDFFA